MSLAAIHRMISIFKLSNKKFMLAILLLLTCARAQASYDVDCVERLMSNQPSSAMIEFKSMWLPVFQRYLGLDRPLSNMEFEAVMDWYRGLSLIAVFDDGKKASFLIPNTRSFKKMGGELKKRTIAAVTLLPESLTNLGRIFTVACEALGRPGCMSYKYYFGLGSTTSRPMSAAEEQAVKWATLYMISPDSMAGTLRASQGSPEEVAGVQRREAEFRKMQARNIIRERFSEADAEALLKNYIEPAISANFARILALYKGNQAH
jgi:hypothetical protein